MQCNVHAMPPIRRPQLCQPPPVAGENAGVVYAVHALRLTCLCTYAASSALFATTCNG